MVTRTGELILGKYLEEKESMLYGSVRVTHFLPLLFHGY